ncbi:MAG: precorrin-6A/cobalt-precorrin-6A reductase, partial [Alphaproteobacteria bacterium]
LVLDRPPWRRRPGDDWREVEDVHTAARLAPRLGRRIFVTVGQGELQAFAGLAGAWLLVRLVDRPRTLPPLADHEVILARGPFSLDGEKKLLGDHRIEVLVTKASGGAATEAKLHAARALGLPVVMVRRPDPERGPRVESVTAAVEWVREQADQAQPA